MLFYEIFEEVFRILDFLFIYFYSRGLMELIVSFVKVCYNIVFVYSLYDDGCYFYCFKIMFYFFKWVIWCGESKGWLLFIFC